MYSYQTVMYYVTTTAVAYTATQTVMYYVTTTAVAYTATRNSIESLSHSIESHCYRHTAEPKPKLLLPTLCLPSHNIMSIVAAQSTGDSGRK